MEITAPKAKTPTGEKCSFVKSWDIKGKFISKINKQTATFYVVNNDVECLLSRDTSTALGLVKRLHNINAFSAVRCQPVKIKLKEGTTPYSLATSRRVPIPPQERVKKELQRMKDLDVIEDITEPTDWVSPMVSVVKKNGDIRICVDLKKLNKAVQRERYVIPSFEEIVHKLKGSTIFSKLDAQSGFCQIPLDPETAKLTTFITPFGRYFMKRLPFGIRSAPEIFMRIVSAILEGIDEVVCYFDDILCQSKSPEDHEKLLELVHKRLKEASLQLNTAKCEYKKSEITFLGHIVSAEGCRPDPMKIEAIQGLPAPSDVSALRRYLGMVNYLGKYLPHLSTILRPLNELLSKDTTWMWGPPQRTAFNKVKELLIKPPVLAYFDPKKPTVVEADSSSYGLEGCLLQEHEEGLRPVAFCSRSLSNTEQRYAQIEKECLASVWACEQRFDRYLMGLDSFTLYSDHKPLIPLINSKDLSETPLRCQRMLVRLLRYKPVSIHQPGKVMVTSDTLSRSPAACSQETSNLQEDVRFHVSMVTSSWSVSDAKLRQLKEETQQDVSLRTAINYTVMGWPTYKQDVMLAARDLFDFRNELSLYDGLFLRGDKIVIPYSMRKEILDRIHDGHLGITKCRERANQGVWWPGLSKQIQDRMAMCKLCMQKNPAQQSEPLLPSTLPDRPFQRIGVDLCELKGKHFLVSVDYFSRYIDILPLQSLTSGGVINKMKQIFSQHGIAETVISDNGPQFAAKEFQQFDEEWNFHHATSSTHYPQANGEAERAVRSAKKFYAKMTHT